MTRSIGHDKRLSGRESCRKVTTAALVIEIHTPDPEIPLEETPPAPDVAGMRLLKPHDRGSDMRDSYLSPAQASADRYF